MKFVIILVCVVLLIIPMVACKAPETPQSRRLAAIDKELKENDAKIKSLPSDSIERQKLQDRQLDLRGERKNVIQKANQAN